MVKHYNALIETFLALGIVVGFGSVQGNPGFIGQALHPFYFVILLIVLRYSYLKGFPSIVASSGVYLGLYFVRISDITLADVEQPAVFWLKVSRSGFRISDLWGLCYHPLAFLAFGLFIGLLAEEDKKKITALQQAISHHTANLERKTQEMQEVLALNARLSDQIITAEQSFNILFEKTKAVFHEDRFAIYHAVYDLLHTLFHSATVALFYRDEEGFRFIPCKEAQSADQPDPLAQYAEHIDLIQQSHKFLRLDMIAEQEVSPQMPVFIGPILHQETDQLHGILVVQDLDLVEYNENTMLTLKNLCKWLGTVLSFRSTVASPVTPAKEALWQRFDFLVDVGATGEQIHDIVEDWFNET